MHPAIPVSLEVGRSRTFACAVEWPGWCRAAKGEEAALRALRDYAPRFARVAERAGMTLGSVEHLTVVETVTGTATTDFGAPDVVTEADRRPLDEPAARRIVALLDAAWKDIGNTALALAYMGNCVDARHEAEVASLLAATSDIPTARAWAAFVTGEVRIVDAPEDAAAPLQEAIDEARAAGNEFIAGVAGLSLLSVTARVGDPHEALTRYPTLLDHWQRCGAWMQQWVTIRTLIETFARVGRDEEAAILYGALSASRTATPVTGADASRLATAVAGVTERLGADRVRGLLREGAALGDEQAVDYALGALRPAD